MEVELRHLRAFVAVAASRSFTRAAEQLARGTVSETRSLRVVHLFDETRVAVCSASSSLADLSELDWNDVPNWTLVVNTVSGTTGLWSWQAGAGPQRIVPTANFDEWLESVAADRGIGVVPDVAQRRSIHPGVREPLLRRFAHAALAAVELSQGGLSRWLVRVGNQVDFAGFACPPCGTSPARTARRLSRMSCMRLRQALWIAVSAAWCFALTGECAAGFPAP